MLDYNLLKTLHIISASLLFGTGLGTFFFMIRACRSGNIEAIKVTANTVVIADWCFTAPAVLVQFASPYPRASLHKYAAGKPWATPPSAR